MERSLSVSKVTVNGLVDSMPFGGQVCGLKQQKEGS
jgi:hypothetical protein